MCGVLRFAEYDHKQTSFKSQHWKVRGEDIYAVSTSVVLTAGSTENVNENERMTEVS